MSTFTQFHQFVALSQEGNAAVRSIKNKDSTESQDLAASGLDSSVDGKAASLIG